MSKNMVIWFIGLPLVVAGSVATGVILANTELISIPSTDPAELILGKWQYAGMDDSVSDTVSPMFRHTIEYFEDGTYQEDREGDSPILDPETINGTYVVLGDGRLKFTYESCHSLPCKDLVYVRKINFPDANTFWVHHEEQERYGIYKREN
jgi:hypothetical protein